MASSNELLNNVLVDIARAQQSVGRTDDQKTGPYTVRSGSIISPHGHSVAGRFANETKAVAWANLLNAAHAEGRASETRTTIDWQDIETAPQDGSEILLGMFRSEFVNPVIMNSCWIAGEERGCYWSDWGGLPSPTHWAPLNHPAASMTQSPSTDKGKDDCMTGDDTPARHSTPEPSQRASLQNETRPATVLRAAKALIGTPEKWTQGESARSVYGVPCQVHEECAVRFCISGAIVRAGIGHYGVAAAAGDYIRRVIEGPSYVDWNDAPERAHADVMAAFDRAIELAEKQS